MELLVDSLGQCPTDAVDFREVCDASLADALQPTELPKQGTTPLGTQPCDRLQTRRSSCSCPTLPVPGNRKPVGFIPDLLDQQECGRVRRQGSRGRLTWNHQLLITDAPVTALGDADQGQVGQLEFLEGSPRLLHLPVAAINKD